MSRITLLAVVFVLLINVAACVGSPGPAGPPGPAGSGGGPPFVWICTPASLPNAGGGSRADVYVFNGSTSPATIAVNILDANGNNLTGQPIPNSPGQTYPGEAGSSTVTLAAAHTRDLNWPVPATGPNPPFDGTTNVAVSVRVTSNQPVVVGANFQFNGNLPSQCSLLPK